MSSPSMHTHVADALGRRLASRLLRPGEVLNLVDIEAEFAVSRTVAREAMRLLESLGMVEIRRRVGLIVAPEEQWDVLSTRVIEWRLAGPGHEAQLRSLLDLRIAVEPTAARLAALHATDRQRESLLELTELLHDLGRQGVDETEEYLAADVGWHQTLCTRAATRCSPRSTASSRPSWSGGRGWGTHRPYPSPRCSTTTTRPRGPWPRACRRPRRSAAGTS